ncbi:MAG: hypothetical protein JWL77_2236 [Chthonomonadaceae bacterium]|nr:hypothetical protein [Chthonomonadaceae bacterium]
MNGSQLQAEIKLYLINLIQGIDQGFKVAGINLQIVSESDLERFVCVKTEGDDTLLKILGYNRATVDDHPTKRVLIGIMQFQPDYVLRNQQKCLAVLDLKKPEEDLNNKKWASQVLTYCQQIEAPFGLLFNGRSLRVFINTECRQLSRYEPRFSIEPVASGEFDKLDQMANLLSKFSFESLEANPMALARKLANAEISIREGQERRKAIYGVLAKSLAASPVGDIREILSALATVTTMWTAVEPKPTDAELIEVWESRSVVPDSRQGTGESTRANPALRAKIAEICSVKGWEVVKQAHIKGLNCRLDGVEEKGFRLVPAGRGVPDGLCVQGKDIPGAKRILQELDRLLTGRTV